MGSTRLVGLATRTPGLASTKRAARLRGLLEGSFRANENVHALAARCTNWAAEMVLVETGHRVVCLCMEMALAETGQRVVWLCVEMALPETGQLVAGLCVEMALVETGPPMAQLCVE